MSPSKSENFRDFQAQDNLFWLSALSSRPTLVASLPFRPTRTVAQIEQTMWFGEMSSRIEETLDMALFNNQLCDFEHDIQSLSIMVSSSVK